MCQKLRDSSQMGRWIQHTCHLSWCVKREVTWSDRILRTIWEPYMQLEKYKIPSWIRVHKEIFLKLNEWQPATILGCLIDSAPLRCNFGHKSKNSLTTAFSDITFANSLCSDRIACPDPSSCCLASSLTPLCKSSEVWYPKKWFSLWFLWDLLLPCWWSTDMSPINANVNSCVESTTKQSHFLRWTGLETIGRQVPKSCHFLHECGPSGSGLPPIFLLLKPKTKMPDKQKSQTKRNLRCPVSHMSHEVTKKLHLSILTCQKRRETRILLKIAS